MPGSAPLSRWPRTATASYCTLREPFLAGKGWRHPFTAIHGHTIRGPEVLPHRIAVDSGTYRTGVLSALQIEGDRLRFVCVTSEPKLKTFKRLPAWSSGAGSAPRSRWRPMPEYRLAVGA